MTRTTRALMLALCLTTFGLSALPAAAQAPGPFVVVGPAIPLIRTVTIVGAGATEAEALANALSRLRADYLVMRYTVIRTLCTEVELPSGPNDINGPETFMLCSAEVQARVIPKATFFPFP